MLNRVQFQLPSVTLQSSWDTAQDIYTRIRQGAGYVCKGVKVVHAALTSEEAFRRYSALVKTVRDLISIAWAILKFVGSRIDSWAIDPDESPAVPPELPPVVTEAIQKAGDRVVWLLDRLLIAIDKVRDRMVILLHPEFRENPFGKGEVIEPTEVGGDVVKG